MRIGVLGGTFDPVHLGHLFLADEARFTFEMERVLMVPSARPPHKAGKRCSPYSDRIQMLRLAVEGNPWLEVSDIESRRDEPSYTVVTLRGFLAEYGPGTEIYFIAGADELREIGTWKDPGEVLSLCRFVAAARPGYPVNDLEGLMRGVPGGADLLDRVLPLEIPALEISATDIRARASGGRPFRYMVPEPVWRYIDEKRLYR